MEKVTRISTYKAGKTSQYPLNEWFNFGDFEVTKMVSSQLIKIFKLGNRDLKVQFYNDGVNRCKILLKTPVYKKIESIDFWVDYVGYLHSNNLNESPFFIPSSLATAVRQRLYRKGLTIKQFNTDTRLYNYQETGVDTIKAKISEYIPEMIKTAYSIDNGISWKRVKGVYCSLIHKLRSEFGELIYLQRVGEEQFLFLISSDRINKDLNRLKNLQLNHSIKFPLWLYPKSYVRKLFTTVRSMYDVYQLRDNEHEMVIKKVVQGFDYTFHIKAIFDRVKETKKPYIIPMSHLQAYKGKMIELNKSGDLFYIYEQNDYHFILNHF